MCEMEGTKGWRIQLINWKECWFRSLLRDIFGSTDERS